MNNKKSLIAILLVAIIGIVGLTFAYFRDSVTLPNKFKTKPFITSVTEEFESPDDWTPGTTTNKTVYATNDGDADVAVRASFTESWVSEDGTNLSLFQDQDGTSVRAAIINFADDFATYWVKSTEDGKDYYYYKNKLTKGNSSSSFIKSVKFNENIVSDSNCTQTDLNDEDTGNKIGIRKTCTSSQKGYDGATYTLTIKVETVQYDAYKEAWNTNVVIN